MGRKALPRSEAFHRPDGITEITLIHGEICLVNTEKYPMVANGRWYAHRYVTVNGIELTYARTSLPDPTGKSKTGFRGVLMHKLLTGNPKTDHFNRNGLDNRMENLRGSTQGQNTFNCQKTTINRITKNPPTSKHVGVFFRKQKGSGWFGCISAGGKQVKSGRFATEMEALEWRVAAEKKYYPEFIRYPDKEEAA